MHCGKDYIVLLVENFDKKYDTSWHQQQQQQRNNAGVGGKKYMTYVWDVKWCFQCLFLSIVMIQALQYLHFFTLCRYCCSLPSPRLSFLSMHVITD